MDATKTQIRLEREFNNYLVPLFQFGLFSNEDLEFSPGPLMTFNGRVHSNRNIYALQNIKFLNRVSMAGELVRNATRGGEPNTATGSDQVWFEVNGLNVQSTEGSVQASGSLVGGPNFNATPGQRGYHPDSPDGTPNTSWESESIKPADGAPNHFGGQVLTNTTGANELKTPLELEGNSPAEIIKRSLPSDTYILSTSRYHNKSQVRILIDDELAGNGAANVAGIPAGKGVLLSTFMPSILGGGNVLRTIDNNGVVGLSVVEQRNPDGTVSPNASSVRTVQSTPDPTAIPYVPRGADISGRILIEIVKPDGTTLDVTQEILSMGVTVGEPNGIVYVQRPLWAAAVQGSRDREDNDFDLVTLTNAPTQIIADGEIADPATYYDADRGFITMTNAQANEDAGTLIREAVPSGYNSIVPINVYNVREGWFDNTLPKEDVYPERGITSVVELNMRNLTRWLDGVYDTNLLAGTNAVSTNVKGDEGYVVYLSDRRGDQVKAEYLADGTSYASTNGTVDNEDIYGTNGLLDSGEDVIDFGWNIGGTSKKGTLQKDTNELPDSSTPPFIPASPTMLDRRNRANTVMNYSTNYFRRGVRLFDGERLMTNGGAGKLSEFKGITVAAENMVYIWGNYNTSGVTGIPGGGSTINFAGGYSGPQVPASIVCDAFFPLSKTWFDNVSALFPEGSSDAENLSGEPYRMADDKLDSILDGTAVRAGVIAGTTISGMTATPGRTASGLRRNGGIINYPRFLEIWNMDDVLQAWSYSGSFVPMFRSTQAVSQWEQDTSVIYLPPRRNWSFDPTFLNPNRLPPGTPFFQYVQATGFRQVIR